MSGVSDITSVRICITFKVGADGNSDHYWLHDLAQSQVRDVHLQVWDHIIQFNSLLMNDNSCKIKKASSQFLFSYTCLSGTYEDPLEVATN